MTDGNTYAINKHLNDQEDWDALQEVTAELEQAEGEAEKYHDAWLEAEAKIVELEAKLAKAVWRLEEMRDDDTGYRNVVHFRRGAAVTLAELSKERSNEKGQDYE